MREHAAEAQRDLPGLAQIVGHAVRAQASDERGEPRGMVGLAPRDLRRGDGERTRVGIAVCGLVDEDAVEQELDTDMRDRAARPPCARAIRELRVELAHQRRDRGQAVERGIGRVVQRDAARDVRIVRVGEACARHRREVRQHRAEHDRGRVCRPARDRRVTEEVHRSLVASGAMLVVGLDLGTQSCKAVVCDERMGVRGEGAVKYATSHPRPDEAEQDPATWDAALAPAIGAALERAGARADDIAALAIAGQLDGCIAVDGDGHALHPALIWQDRRATAEAVRYDASALFELTGQVADASHMAPKIRWLRERVPGAIRFHQPVTYLVERLTGEAVIDAALASTTMLLSLADRRWSKPLLDAYEIDARELPAIRPTCSLAGTLTDTGARLTGLRAGTPVAVGTGDDFATPLGGGVIAPDRTLVCAIGTAEVVGTLAAARILDDAPEPMVETHAYPSDAYFVENPGWLSGGAVRWAQRALGIANDAELDALAAAAPPGADGVTFIPALAGAMTPVWRPHARGGFYGIAAGHERAHLARAVLEGLAFACRDVAERLTRMGLVTDRALLLGGGSRSKVWAQIRADVLDKPHAVAWSADTCPVGAAMIAAVAAGSHADLPAAAACLPASTETFAPRGNLDDAYARYERLVAQLAPLAIAPWR